MQNQILQGNISFPRWIDKNAKSFIKKLLVADITKRYGCMKAGAEDVKEHKWFGGFAWEDLVEKSMTAPIIPHVSYLCSREGPHPTQRHLIELLLCSVFVEHRSQARPTLRNSRHTQTLPTRPPPQCIAAGTRFQTSEVQV